MATNSDQATYYPEFPQADGPEIPYPEPLIEANVQVDAMQSTPDWPLPDYPKKGAPNILLVMTDDVGYGSASTFGGPANTHTMSKLAKDGTIYNRFHTTAMCSPTRAALLTGRHPHNVSFGIVADAGMGYPGYCARIPKNCATVAQILKMHGYNTGMFGKNHNIPMQHLSSSGPYDYWPTGLGFEHFYGFNGGESDQWFPNLYADTVPIQPYEGKEGEYHLDTDLADQAIQFIKERNTVSPDKPFFVYYAPGAAHAPHHVPEEWREKYKGKFDQGWDVLREEILERQKALGICPHDTKLTPRPENIPAWDDLDDERKSVYARMMEVFAAFLEFTDHNIGRVVEYIENSGEIDKTLIIYIQGDNGGSAEGTLQGTTNEVAVMGNGLTEDFEIIKRSLDELGGPLHNNLFPVGWAWACNSPMQWAKRYASHFGGTRNGMVMRWPGVVPKGAIRSQFHHVIDITPTIMEAAKVPPSYSKVNGIQQRKLDGVSMTYTWTETQEDVEHRPEMIFEMAGNRGLYLKPYMLSSTPKVFSWVTDSIPDLDESSWNLDEDWELYNVDEDFSQGNNLLADGKNAPVKYKAIRDEMYKKWMELAKKNNIFPLAFTEDHIWHGQEGIPKLSAGAGKFIYPDNIIRVPEYVAPDCKNTSYKITAHIVNRIDRRGELEGVIFSLGGFHGGFALYIANGIPIWVYKCTQWKELTFRIKGREVLPRGHVKIMVKFDKNAGGKSGNGGVFSLYVDGDLIGKVATDVTVRTFFSMTETLDIGQDTGTPVDNYWNKMPYKFNGRIKEVVFDVDEIPEAEAEAIEKDRRQHLLRTE